MGYIRKTRDEFHIEGDYGKGWEMVTVEITYKEARDQLRCYNMNEPYPHRIRKRRIKI
jgi:hypothetical protein